MASLIEKSVEGQVVRVWINRPEKRNALNQHVVQGLIRALEIHQEDASRVVVLGGRGKVFSAGADLKSLQQLQDASADENLQDSRLLAQLFELIHTYPKPVVSRIHGHAIAGGCGLAAVCDFSLASEKAKLGFTEVRIGFVPAIVSVFLRHKLSDTALRELLLSGSVISAEKAASVGLITRVVSDDELDTAVDQLVEEVARETSATAVAQTKKLLAALPGMGFKEALDHAVQANALARSTEDCQAGIAAFLSGDDPPWKEAAETPHHIGDKNL